MHSLAVLILTHSMGGALANEHTAQAPMLFAPAWKESQATQPRMRLLAAVQKRWRQKRQTRSTCK